MSALGLLWLALGVSCLGLATLRLTRASLPNRQLHFGLAIALGLAAAMFALYLPLACFERVVFWPTQLLCALAVGFIALDFFLHRPPSIAVRWRSVLPWTLLAAALVIVARAHAFDSYDERAIYGLKGKALFLERGIDGAVFQDPEAVHFHRDYPLGVPLLMAWAADTAGAPASHARDERAAASAAGAPRPNSIDAYVVLAALWALGLALLAWGWMVHCTEAKFARLLFAPLLLPVALLFPWLGGPAWSWAGADVPLALLVGAAVTSLHAWHGRRHGASMLLCGGLLAGAMCLKQDAWLALFAALVALATQRSLGRASLALILPLCAAVLVRAVSGRIPDAAFEDSYLEGFASRPLAVYVERLPQLVAHTLETLSEQHMLAFWLASLLLGLPLGWRRGGWMRLVAVWVATHAALTLFVFLVSPHNLDWHVGTALPRVLGQASLPAGMLLIAACVQLWRAPLEAFKGIRAPAAH